MNKILKKVHPYEIFYSESDNRYHTYVKDISKLSGRKAVVRKSEKDLEKYLLEYYHIKLNNKKTYTFESLYQEFMEYKDATQAKTTIRSYIQSYNKFYRDDPIIKKDMAELAPPTLKIWLQRNIDKYKMNYKSYAKFSVVWYQMYKYANEMGYLQNNPFEKISSKSLGLYNAKKKKGKQKVFSKEETKDICKIAMDDFKEKPYCVPLAVLFTFQTGMRIGEIVALKWSDIDFESKTVTVCRFERVQMNYDKKFTTLSKQEHVIIDCDTKGQFGERIVDLTDDAIYILELLRDFYESENLKSEWLFVNHSGRIHNRAMDLRIRRYCRLAGTEEKSMHKIRSTYISLLRDAGMSFEKIAEEVGHKSVLTTMQHYSFDTLEDYENRKILNEGLKLLSS